MMATLFNFRMPGGIVVLLACCLFASTAHGMYDKSDSVLEITAKNFASLVEDSNVISVVEFYAPWCGHCKALAPAYKKVAEKLEVTPNPYNCRGYMDLKHLCCLKCILHPIYMSALKGWVHADTPAHMSFL